MNKLHLKYKQETGKNSYIEFETALYSEWLYWCVSQDDLEARIPSSFDNGEIKLASDGYIEWLEEKLKKAL